MIKRKLFIFTGLNIEKRLIYFKLEEFPLRIDAAEEAGERIGFPDVLDLVDPGRCSFDAKSETGMRN